MGGNVLTERARMAQGAGTTYMRRSAAATSTTLSHRDTLQHLIDTLMSRGDRIAGCDVAELWECYLHSH
jgi:hypothetical protein